MSADIPKAGVRAYLQHQRNAKRRGIPFLFTLTEWWDWWQVDDRWLNRGRGKTKLCMARRGDIGPYSPGNVYCATHAENGAAIDFTLHASTWRQGFDKSRAEGRTKDPHQGVRGDGHPRSKAVITPQGRFGSAALAADAFGINPGTATERARKRLQGWAYEAG